MSSFNSATAAEPWRLGRFLCSKHRDCFNSATAAEPWRFPATMAIRWIMIVLQFGHGCGAVEITNRPGRIFKRSGVASIRPRLRSRGDYVVSRFCTSEMKYSFNSATAAEPWRLPTGEDQANWESVKLQFGHGCGAVEIPKGIVVAAGAGYSFNSATAAEPWRLSLELDARAGGRGLQFGHGCGAVEISLARLRHDEPQEELQFGHGCGAVEIGFQPLTDDARAAMASIRPRLRSRGD